MREAVFQFQFLTPAIFGGADQQSAEMRIPSLRGALRWWTRLIYGREYEEDVFGCVKGKKCASSDVRLRLLNSSGRVLRSQNAQSLIQDQYDYFLWPFRQNTRGVLDAGSRCTVSLTLRPGAQEIDEEILKSFLLYGSLGTRSRRAYGSVWPLDVTIDGEKWKIPSTVDELLDETDAFFGEKKISIYRLSGGKRDYKDAVKVCAKILKGLRCGKDQYGFKASTWGKNDHDVGYNLKSDAPVYRAALGLPLIQHYTGGRVVVEYSISGMDRFASPLHFKVIKLAEGFVPLMLVIPEYAPADGTAMEASVGNGRSCRVEFQRELLDSLLDKPSTVNAPGAEMIAAYPLEDE